MQNEDEDENPSEPQQLELTEAIPLVAAFAVERLIKLMIAIMSINKAIPPKI